LEEEMLLGSMDELGKEKRMHADKGSGGVRKEWKTW
jgi:hypothetical protein